MDIIILVTSSVLGSHCDDVEMLQTHLSSYLEASSPTLKRIICLLLILFIVFNSSAQRQEGPFFVISKSKVEF